MFFECLDKSFSATGIGIAAVHKTMYKRLIDTVLGSDIAQNKKVIERTVHTAVGYKPHKMNLFPVLTSICKGFDNLGVGENRLVGTSTVYLHQVLIYDATGTDIEVSDFGVSHLAVGQADIFSRSLQL